MKLVLTMPVQEAEDLCSKVTAIMSHLSYLGPLSCRYRDRETEMESGSQVAPGQTHGRKTP